MPPSTPLYDLIVGKGFDRYVSGLSSRFARSGLTFTHSYGEISPDPALVIRLENDAVVSELIAWSSGHCDAEALAIDSGRRVYYSHRELESEGDFHQALADLTNSITEAEQVDGE